jgi:hypothetical protein
MPVIACSVRTVPLVLALAWAVADVCPASARCTATCVCGRTEPFAVTVTRLTEAPNDWMSLVTRDAVVPVLPPAVSREDWRTAAV